MIKSVTKPGKANKQINEFETGLAEHHKFISTITKSVIQLSPRKVYRSYKYCDIDLFKLALHEELKHLENDTYKSFKRTSTTK